MGLLQIFDFQTVNQLRGGKQTVPSTPVTAFGGVEDEGPHGEEPDRLGARVVFAVPAPASTPLHPLSLRAERNAGIAGRKHLRNIDIVPIYVPSH